MQIILGSIWLLVILVLCLAIVQIVHECRTKEFVITAMPVYSSPIFILIGVRPAGFYELICANDIIRVGRLLEPLHETTIYLRNGDKLNVMDDVETIYKKIADATRS